ncbi:MAG: hypothetical protein IPK65_05125 [Gammaproteobacteria bacterium]|nr:hypothetical protein [Gammaproteobacteria bacterium]
MTGSAYVLRLSVLLGVLLLSLPAVGVRADVTDPGIVAARALFYQGVDGDKRAVREALRQFRGLKAGQPDNPLVQAYIGACAALLGRDGSNVTAKRTNTGQGVRDLDAALAMLARLTADDGAGVTASAILETKLVVANAFLHIPSFYNRLQEGERLLTELRQDPRLDFMSPGFRASVLVSAAAIAQMNERPDDSASLLKRAQQLDPAGREGRRAQQMLAAETE